jgi:hypothetical protein
VAGRWGGSPSPTGRRRLADNGPIATLVGGSRHVGAGEEGGSERMGRGRRAWPVALGRSEGIISFVNYSKIFK